MLADCWVFVLLLLLLLLHFDQDQCKKALVLQVPLTWLVDAVKNKQTGVKQPKQPREPSNKSAK
jgi:hypothetical protein